jgi:chromate transport protein ChrA
MKRLTRLRDLITIQLLPPETPVGWQILGRTFLKLGATGFGGGIAVIAQVRRIVVRERHWLSDEEFLDAVSLAQSLPGANASNAITYIGLKLGGIRGATASAVSFVLPSFLMMIGLTIAHNHFHHLQDVQRVFQGLNAAVVGLIAATAVRLGKTAMSRQWHLELGIATAFVLIFMGASVAEVVLLAGMFGIFVQSFKVRARHRMRQQLHKRRQSGGRTAVATRQARKQAAEAIAQSSNLAADHAVSDSLAPASDNRSDGKRERDEDRNLEASAQDDRAATVKEHAVLQVQLHRAGKGDALDVAAHGGPVVRASARYVRVAPRKARLVADQVRGLTVPQAQTLLEFSARGASSGWATTSTRMGCAGPRRGAGSENGAARYVSGISDRTSRALSTSSGLVDGTTRMRGVEALFSSGTRGSASDGPFSMSAAATWNSIEALMRRCCMRGSLPHESTRRLCSDGNRHSAISRGWEMRATVSVSKARRLLHSCGAEGTTPSIGVLRDRLVESQNGSVLQGYLCSVALVPDAHAGQTCEKPL